MDTIVDNTYLSYKNLIAFDWTSLATTTQNLVMNLNSLTIQLSDQAIACQYKLQIKQFATRTQEWSGLFNSIYTFAYGIAYNEIVKISWLSWMPVATQTNMNVAFWNMWNPVYKYFADGTKLNCRDFGFNWGLFMSEFLEAKVDTKVAFIEVQKLQ